MAIKLALVGEESLLGRELKEVFETRFPGSQIEGYASSGEGNFSDREGETVFVRALDSSSFANGEVLLLAGSSEGALKACELGREADPHPVVLDCSGNLESQPEARLVSPLVEETKKPADSWLFVLTHPASAALALTVIRLAKYKVIRSAIANIFEPASERGKRGLLELHGQTTNLLAFKALDKEVFDGQLAFNLLSRYGEEAPMPLSRVESRIEREVATLLNRRANGVVIPMPSIRVVQAPVFHGCSISLWVEFEADVRTIDLEEALASAQIEIRTSDEDPPSNASVTGQSGLQIGDIRIDSNNSRAAWLWIVADNLRLMADAAADFLRLAQ